MVVETMTTAQDITALSLYSRCIDLNSTFGAEHRDAQTLLEKSGGLAALGEMHDRYMQLLDTRPSAHRIEAHRGDVDGTLREIEATLAAV